MGCWSHEVFCDDTSLDALDELNYSDDPAADIERFLEEAAESDYLDYDVCQYALAAAALVDAALNGIDLSLLTGRDDDIGIKSLLERLSADKMNELRQCAVNAIELAAGENSELRELAEENEEHFIKWKEVLDKIKKRLS